MNGKSETVTVGEVTLKIYQYSGKGWRFVWRDHSGVRKYTTRKSKDAIRVAARERAEEISRRRLAGAGATTREREIGLEFLSLNPTWEQFAMVREFVQMGPTWEDLEHLRKLRDYPQHTVEESVSAFLEHKEATRGNSIHNIRSLNHYLSKFRRQFGNSTLRDVTARDLQVWIDNLRNRDGTKASARSRLNLRNSVRSLYRWAQRMDYLPKGETAADSTTRPIVARAEPETWTPDELRTLLLAVEPKYAPWLVFTCFAGLRTEELYPQPGSEKAALRWEDVRWKEGIIVVPESVSKTRRGIVPILPAVEAWLAHHGVEPGKGEICSGTPPYHSRYKKLSQTQKLGELVGGWRTNANRHSFISYRSAIVGLAQAAMEARNSEAEASKSYLHAKSQEEAEAYFGVRP